MRIQLRVRTNDLGEDQIVHQMATDAFVLYDNCSEVKFGKKQLGVRPANETVLNRVSVLKDHRHAESGELFSEVIFMVRDTQATVQRLNKEKAEAIEKATVENPFKQEEFDKKFKESFHYNVIEWKDRLSNKRIRLIFDTVVFITDDQGNTIRKIDG